MNSPPAPPTDPAAAPRAEFRRAVRAILIGRGLFGAAALVIAASVGGAWGAAMAAVVLVYLAATLYWSRRLSGRAARRAE